MNARNHCGPSPAICTAERTHLGQLACLPLAECNNETRSTTLELYLHISLKSTAQFIQFRASLELKMLRMFSVSIRMPSFILCSFAAACESRIIDINEISTSNVLRECIGQMNSSRIRTAELIGTATSPANVNVQSRIWLVAVMCIRCKMENMSIHIRPMQNSQWANGICSVSIETCRDAMATQTISGFCFHCAIGKNEKLNNLWDRFVLLVQSRSKISSFSMAAFSAYEYMSAARPVEHKPVNCVPSQVSAEFPVSFFFFLSPLISIQHKVKRVRK